jgi:hypothetical protein
MRVNDIGILFVAQPIEFSAMISPIILPPLVSKNQPFINEQGMVLGFAGPTSTPEGLENLQAAHVRVMQNSDCMQLYPNADMNQNFCAHDTERQSNFCLGDQVNVLSINCETC